MGSKAISMKGIRLQDLQHDCINLSWENRLKLQKKKDSLVHSTGAVLTKESSPLADMSQKTM